MSGDTRGVQRGRLKVLLGYAAGVGKTFRMLDEAHELRAEGVDVVIGYFEPHGRKDTIEKAAGLEVVPRRVIECRAARFEEMDTDAILRRRPLVCAVDELAHTNVPGSERAKRWEDVQVLLDQGIHVLTTMNVQHLESLNDEVWHITGVRVRETAPDWVVDQAHEVVMIDLPPEALLNRLKRGAVYVPEKAERAMAHFFTPSNLSALREIALRHTAHDVAERLSLMASPTATRPAPARAPARAECVLICLSDNPANAMLIRRGKRVADFLQARCIAVHVARPGSSAEGEENVARHTRFARNLRIDTHELQGDDRAAAIVDFARRHGVTQIFVGQSRPRPCYAIGEMLVDRLVHLARDMEVTIVAAHRR